MLIRYADDADTNTNKHGDHAVKEHEGGGRSRSIKCRKMMVIDMFACFLLP